MKKFVIIDIETTGNQYKQDDKIIEVGAVVIENGEITERFSSFVNPKQPVPPFIQQLTGINDDMLKRAPSFREVAPMLLEAMEGAYFVAHNVQFDLPFIQQEMENCNIPFYHGPVIDTVELARILYPTIDGYKLSQLAETLHLDHEHPHRALSDAEVTAELLLMMLDRLSRLPEDVLLKLRKLSSGFHSDLNSLISAMINERNNLKELFSENGRVNQEISPSDQSERTSDYSGVDSSPTFEEFINTLKEPTGPFIQAFDDFEVRAGQELMMKTVADALNGRRYSLIEAGTGIGKTIAYLLPALFFAKHEKKPVVISTYTNQLQDQLMQQDLPIVNKILPFEARAAILKGRNHYLCKGKFDHYFEDTTDDNYDITLTKAQILVWLTETETGDVDELNLPSGGKTLWRKINANHCMPGTCPWYPTCFYQRAYQKAEQSDLIVTNHALLFSDVLRDPPSLPPFQNVIIDEAHHMEETASKQFGKQTNFLSINNVFAALGKGNDTNLLARVSGLFSTIGSTDVMTFFNELDSQLSETKNDIDDVFRMLYLYVLEMGPQGKSEVGRLTYSFNPRSESSFLWENIVEAAKRIRFGIKDIVKTLGSIEGAAARELNKLQYHEKVIYQDFKDVIEELVEKEQLLYKLLVCPDEPEETHVHWLEIEPKGAKNAVYLYSQPISVNDILADHFFANKHAVVMTSATLTMNGSFHYMINRLGLSDFVPDTQQIASPFLYKNQVKMMIPKDLPNIKDVSSYDFVQAISKQIIEIAKVTRGRMLILFTSYDMLSQTYQQVKKANTAEQFVLIGQGINSGSRAKLIKTFKQYENAILFGTSSFWEGIDIPGDDLTCITIVRLPFSPPDDPVVRAQAKAIKEQGGSPFNELSLPKAVIRFKQGFGRLIRSQQDKGVIFILDRRITTTHYGKQFIESLPKIEILEDHSKNLIKELQNWL